MNNEDMLKAMREDLQEAVECAYRPYPTGLIANVLLLQVLDKLEDINTKIALMNINIQDVEQAVLAPKEQEP